VKPNSLLAEQSVLGSMLISKNAIVAVSEILQTEHFYQPNHESIHLAIINLVADGEPVDATTVAARLESMGVLKRIGGPPYLLTLTGCVPSPTNARSYAQIVYDKWRQRQIIEAGYRFVQLGLTETQDTAEVDHLLAEADKTFRQLGEPSHSGIMWDDLIIKWRDWQGKDDTAMATPWDDLNDALHGGTRPGQLVIFGGRPGEGKSISGLNLLLGAAEAGHRATVFSVEMDDMEVCTRLLAAASWCRQGPIFSRRMDKETWVRVEEAIASRQGMPLEIVDQAYITVEQIIAHCRVRRPDIIFVDYAQLIKATDSKVSREQQVAHITRSLKIAAKHLKMCVIVAAQLNRGPAAGRRPVISDLRESGAAEQDADIVILLYRDENAPEDIDLIVGKNRNGPTPTVTVPWRGNLSRIG
jgi:replicative DNA helicase